MACKTLPLLTLCRQAWRFVTMTGLAALLAACAGLPAHTSTPATTALRTPVTFSELPGWSADDLTQAWPAFLESCKAVGQKPDWQVPCRQAAALSHPDNPTLHQFFETYFTPYRLKNTDQSSQGLITGYYEPQLRGSLAPDARFRYPLYGKPADLVTVDMAARYPQLKGVRLRGRLAGSKVVPYYSRAEIDSHPELLKGDELAWTDDPLALFFLQIQGSGRVVLKDGRVLRVGYADQNGYPYTPIGKVLVEEGELQRGKATMPAIRAWAQAHPDKLAALLDDNASYVFFKWLPSQQGGPLGALGVPLTPGRSIAVDKSKIPLGAPVFLATTLPRGGQPLQRLMLAQDTGGAIRGGVRADVFWGPGAQAETLAGTMQQQGAMWLLLPKTAGR